MTVELVSGVLQGEAGVTQLVAEHGVDQLREDLRTVFSEVASRLGGLERLQHDRVLPEKAGDFVRTLRRETLLASNAAWRALFVALHDAKTAGVEPAEALERLKENPAITWDRQSHFFKGSLLEADPETGEFTGRLLSSRKNIDTAAQKLLSVMLNAQGSEAD